MNNVTITSTTSFSKGVVVPEYQPFYIKLAELEQNNSKIVFDYNSKKGNKEARSHVWTLRQSKASLERARTAAKAQSRAVGLAIDSEAKSIGERIGAMIDVHQNALDIIDKAESDRIALLDVRLAQLSNVNCGDGTSASIKRAVDSIELIVIDDTWQEYKAKAENAKDACLFTLGSDLLAKQNSELKAIEEEKCRVIAADLAQKERDTALIEKAKVEAQAEAEAKVVEQAESARRAIEAAAQREAQLKIDAENTERRRIESEEKTAKDKIDAQLKAEAEKQAAIKAEQAKAAALAQAIIDQEKQRINLEAAAKAQREANIEHKSAINRAALAALMAGGISEVCAKDCIKLIALGKVPAIAIAY